MKQATTSTDPAGAVRGLYWITFDDAGPFGAGRRLVIALNNPGAKARRAQKLKIIDPNRCRARMLPAALLDHAEPIEDMAEWMRTAKRIDKNRKALARSKQIERSTSLLFMRYANLIRIEAHNRRDAAA